MKTTDREAISPAAWRTIFETFADVLELPEPVREDRIRSAARGAGDIAEGVRGLLFEYENAAGFLESPALAIGPLVRAEAKHIFGKGETLAGRFQIARLLGSGGMGEVYEAFDASLRQTVAIKTLHPASISDAGLLDRFRGEILRSRQITHPNVARVHDLFTHTAADGVEIPFFTMELVQGETLSHWLAEHGPFSPDAALPLLKQMAAALEAAHSVGIVHRDFKPSNVFVCRDDGGALSVKVADFGLATEAGDGGSAWCGEAPENASTIAGTPAYMAPEQVAGERSTASADLYALALVACEMVTGEQVFPATSPLLCALKKLGPDEVNLPGAEALPERWAAAIRRALQQSPANRQASVAEFMAELSPPEMAADTGWTRRRVAIMGGLAALVGGGAFLAGRVVTKPNPAEASVVVLPFESQGVDRYFSDGLAEELTAQLTLNPGLRVAARSAAFALHDKSTPGPQIARTLNVRKLLSGSVARTADRVRVSVKLVDAASGRQLWTNLYDRPMQQVFAIENEIAREVGTILAPGGADKLRAAPTENSEAHDLFLRGRYLWNTRTHEGMLKAIELYDRAIGLDGKFALAYTSKADAYCALVDYGWMPAMEAAPKVREALARALSLDPESAEARASQGMFNNLIAWDQAGAERAFEKALSLNPALLSAHQWYGNYLMRARKFDRALSEAEIARKLDPVSLPTLVFVGWVRYYRGEFAESIAIGKQVLELNPLFPHGHQLLALSYASQGNQSEALKSSDEAVRLTADHAVALRYRALTYSLLPGLKAEATKAAAELAAASQGRQAGYLVIVYAGLGDREHMYQWIDRGLATHDTSLTMVNIAHAVNRFRDEPRFHELLGQLGYRAGATP